MKTLLLALCLAFPSIVSADPIPAAYATGAASGKIGSDHFVVWTAPVLEQQFDPKIPKIRQSVFDRMPSTLYRGEATDKANILATLNKALEVAYQKAVTPAVSSKGEFEKAADFEARVAKERQAQGSPQLKANILSALMGSYFWQPTLKIDRYDADREVLGLRIVPEKSEYKELEQFTLPFELKMAPKHAQFFKERIGYVKPAVYFELKGSVLTARFIDVFFDSSIGPALREASDFFNNGLVYEKKVNFVFGEATAATYEKDLQARAQMRKANYEAERQKMQWYPVYAKFKDAPIACQVMKHEIAAAGAMNGSSPEGQAKTTEYAKRIARGAPDCLQ